MKRNQVAVDSFLNSTIKPRGCVATVIGKRPKYRPYVNIETADGRDLLVSINDAAMNRLVKKWVKAWGGYPK